MLVNYESSGGSYTVTCGEWSYAVKPARSWWKPWTWFRKAKTVYPSRTYTSGGA